MISIFYENEGVSRLFVHNFCLTVTKNFVGEQFSVSEIFNYRKIFFHEKGISRFCVENFCLTAPKNFVGDPFCVSKKFLYRKFSCIGRGGGIMVLPEIFCFTGPKNFVRGAFCFTKVLVSKKFMDKRGEGVSRFSVKNFLSHSAEKSRRGTL